mmetsp:Transcript_65568/g.179852  ORF Transcript_65568/g.179852 Transcript_65568/m.179852 type:complete len:230 (+) Transcript_65568:97-786(+)
MRGLASNARAKIAFCTAGLGASPRPACRRPAASAQPSRVRTNPAGPSCSETRKRERQPLCRTSRGRARPSAILALTYGGGPCIPLVAACRRRQHCAAAPCRCRRLRTGDRVEGGRGDNAADAGWRRRSVARSTAALVRPRSILREPWCRLRLRASAEAIPAGHASQLGTGIGPWHLRHRRVHFSSRSWTKKTRYRHASFCAAVAAAPFACTIRVIQHLRPSPGSQHARP